MTRKIKQCKKEFVNHAISANCYVIVVFLIYSQFGAIRKPGYRRIVCKTYIFINSNLLSYKNWKQNLKISNTTLTLFLWVKVLFLPKNADFLPRKCWHQKNLESLGIKMCIFWNQICVFTYESNFKVLA